MTSKKKNLIEALHGSYMFVANLPELIDKETIYDSTGHVDTEFMTAILEFMSRMAQVTNDVNKSLARLLGIEETEGKKNAKEDNGSRWSVEEILKHCTLEDNVLRLPQVQFNKKSYAEVKKWIEEAGGSWQGGKVQGFIFPFNPERVFSILNEGKRCNLAQDFQFFETPSDVADWLVMLAGGIHEHDKVLEPSAGRGALVRAIHRSSPDVVVDCYEMMPENKELLSGLGGINIIGDDFTKSTIGKKYTKIIANPPFSGNQDIRHVRMMYDMLEQGGTLASITSAHWEFAEEKTCRDFRKWLEDVGGAKYEIESGAFKESGTGVRTLAILIKRN
jgi:hypothetical protein